MRHTDAILLATCAACSAADVGTGSDGDGQPDSTPADAPPAVSITEPSAGDTLAGSITVAVSASDDEAVSAVAFYVDGALQSSDPSPPYTWTWDTCGETYGAHSLEARATDDGGNEGADTVSVSVDQPLEVELAGPSGMLNPSETLVAWVSDDDAPASVVFALDELPIATVSGPAGSAPACTLSCACQAHEAPWDVSAEDDGVHTLTVTVTSSRGSTASDSGSVTVDGDGDGDGYDGEAWGGDDCDDADASVNPGGVEIEQDGTDQDCDGFDSAGCADCSLSEADAQYTGEAADDRVGVSLSSAGDVNADGYDDLIIGAYGNDEGASDGGAAYLLLGSLAPASLGLASASAKFTGEVVHASAGSSVSGAGDMNADGYDDLIIGGIGWSGAYGVYETAWLVLGGSAPASLVLASANAEYSAGVRYGLAGGEVSGAGDVDADGYDDIVISALSEGDGPDDYAGVAYLVLGGAAPASTGLGAADARYSGEAPGDLAGDSMSGAGDVDADGYDDLLIGASGNDEGGTDAGAAYLLLGGSDPASIGLDSANARFTGEATHDSAGYTVSGAGDIDADGYDDLLIGAYGNDDGGRDAGAAYLLLGGSTPASSGLGSANARYTGEAEGDYAGISVSRAGDLDADGYGDLVIGAMSNDDGPGSSGGAAYLVVGGATPASLGLASARTQYTGEADSDAAGGTVSGAGDVDADGYGDVLVGAWRNDDGPGSDAGAAYLILGW